MIPAADPTLSTILALMMLATFALVAGGMHLLLRRRERLKGMLMLVCAAVLAGNVAILTL